MSRDAWGDTSASSNALDSNYTAYHPAEVDPASPSAAPATNFKLLKRSNQNRNHASNSQTVDTKVNEQSVEERERQYEQARARIFEASLSSAPVTTASSNTPTSETTPVSVQSPIELKSGTIIGSKIDKVDVARTASQHRIIAEMTQQSDSNSVDTNVSGKLGDDPDFDRSRFRNNRKQYGQQRGMPFQAAPQFVPQSTPYFGQQSYAPQQQQQVFQQNMMQQQLAMQIAANQFRGPSFAQPQQHQQQHYYGAQQQYYQSQHVYPQQAMYQQPPLLQSFQPLPVPPQRAPAPSVKSSEEFPALRK